MVDMVWDFLTSQPIFYPGVPTYHDKDTRISLQKILSFRYQKKQNKKANRTLNFEGEMETGDDSATMRESFTMVQNIDYTDIDIDYNDILLAHE